MSRLFGSKTAHFAFAGLVATGASVALALNPPPGLSRQGLPEVGTAVATAAEARAGTMSGNDPTSCPAGQLPGLKTDRFPTSASQASKTADEAAVAAADAHAGALVEKAFADSKGSPIWVSAADGKTFVATPLDVGWFASTATVIGCRDPGSMAARLPHATPSFGKGAQK